MRLTLTVLRCPPEVAPETRVITGGEFTAGRGPGVDWVLADPDQIVSRRHFTLALRAGDWQLLDESSNGTYLNSDQAPVGKGSSRTLRSHDRLRFGAYEIEIELDEALAAPSPSGGYDAGYTAALPADPLDDPFYEPLNALDNTPLPERPFEHRATVDDHSSVLDDSWRPPAIAGQGASVSGTMIPPGNLLPDDWGNDLLDGIVPPSAPSAFPPAPAMPFDDPVVSPVVPTGSPFDEAVAAPPGWPVGGPVAAPEAQMAPESPAAVAVSEPPSALLEAFLAGVGLGDARPADPAATMQRLGEALRALVTGIRATLIARASIKSEFRIEQTMIRAHSNNPLKFSADDDDAIAALLGVGRRINMTPAAAVTEALRDMRLHELASMAAMQAGVRALLEGLSPEKIRAASPQGGVSLLPGQQKARAWDSFEALHAKIVQALSDDFDSVFGKAFARAYEEAMDDLSAREKP